MSVVFFADAGRLGVADRGRQFCFRHGGDWHHCCAIKEVRTQPILFWGTMDYHAVRSILLLFRLFVSMKIKCPACATLLNIPDSAAGKVVKCPCGKQLRVPGGAASPASAAPRPAARPGAGQSPRPAPAAPRPAGPRPSAMPSSPDAGIFDELTEQDLQPVKAVTRPGSASAAPTSTSGKLLQQYGAPGEVGTRASAGGGEIASPGVRLSGVLVDGLFQLLGVGIGFGAAFLVNVVMGDTDTAATVGIVFLGIFAVIPPIINVVLISMSGQSIGKKLVGSRIVVEATGATAGFFHGVLMRQILFGFVTGIPFIGGIVALIDPFMVFSENAKTLHDRMAGTIVVRV